MILRARPPTVRPSSSVPITIFFVSPNEEIREEGFNCLFKCDAMCGQLISFEVILEISRLKIIPFDHRPILRERIPATRPQGVRVQTASTEIRSSVPKELSSAQHLHPSRKHRYRSLDEQVVMIRHQHVGMNDPPLDDPRQQRQEPPAIGVIEIDFPSLHASARDMPQRAWILQPQGS